MYNWRRGLAAGAAGFVLAVAAGEWLEPGFVLIAFLLWLGLGFLFLWRYHRGGAVYLLLAALLVGGALGLGRLLSVPGADTALEAQVGQTITLKGRVVAETEERGAYQQLILKPETSRNKILVRAPAFGAVRPGDEVAAAGRLLLPEAFYTETGRRFNYPAFLAKDNIFFVLADAQIEVTSESRFSPMRLISDWRRLFTAALNRSLPPPESALAAGITLGIKQALPRVLEEAFRAVGLSHIIVLSGFNLAVVAAAAAFVFKRWPKRLALAAGGASIVLVALLAGGGAAVTRAALMGLLALWAQGAGRMYQALRALLIVAVGLIVWSPLSLLHDLGFQLSVLATAGVIVGPSRLAPKLLFITERWSLREIVATTIAAQIAVAPLLAYRLGTVSLIALPANVLVLPLVPLAMGLSFLTSLLSIISPLLALPVAAPTYLVLHYFVLVATYLAALPGASLVMPI